MYLEALKAELGGLQSSEACRARRPAVADSELKPPNTYAIHQAAILMHEQITELAINGCIYMFIISYYQSRNPLHSKTQLSLSWHQLGRSKPIETMFSCRQVNGDGANLTTFEQVLNSRGHNRIPGVLNGTGMNPLSARGFISWWKDVWNETFDYWTHAVDTSIPVPLNYLCRVSSLGELTNSQTRNLSRVFLRGHPEKFPLEI